MQGQAFVWIISQALHLLKGWLHVAISPGPLRSMAVGFVFFLNLFILFLFIFGFIRSSLCCAGFSLRWLLLLWSTGSRRAGFSSCGTRAQ